MGLRLGFKKVINGSSSVLIDDIVATDSPALLINVFLSNQHDITSSYEHVALYTKFSDSSRWDENTICTEVNCTAYTPMMMSLDGSVKKMLSTPHAKSLKRIWSIPPGGRARFELIVTSPSREALFDNFFDTFLAKGLIMTTNTRQKIPLIVGYKALLDHVSITSSSPMKVVDSQNKEVLETEFVFSPSHSALLIPLNENNKTISVVIHNAYPDILTINSARSCNRWIHLFMNTSLDSDSTVRSKNAILHSYNPCADSENVVGVNFYTCAIKWLESRSLIQPLGCGESYDVTDEEIRANVIAEFKEIDGYLQRRYSPIQALQQSPIVSTYASKETDEMFRFARYLWTEISRLHINVISGHIITTFKFNEESITDKSEILTSKVQSPKLRSVLHMPSVFGRGSDIHHGDNFLYFNMTRISQVNLLFVPVKNPTGYPLRVRLIAKPHEYINPAAIRDGPFPYLPLNEERVYIPSQPNDENLWWTGHSFMLKDPSAGIYLSKQNTRISAHSPIISSHLPSSYAVTAFAHEQCGGNRCYHSDQVTKNSKNYTDASLFAPIGASAASGEILRGHYYNNDGFEDPVGVFRQRENMLATFPLFALSVDGCKEIIVPPFGSAQLGPVYFRPPSRRSFIGSLFLENSLNGLEPIKIEGKGAWSKLILLDMSTNANAENLVTRFGMQAFIFPISSAGFNGAVVQSLGVTNVGDTTVNVTKIYLSPPIASSLKKRQRSRYISNRCQERSFRILGCYDRVNTMKSKRVNFIAWFLSKVPYFGIAARSVSNLSEYDEPNVAYGFPLQPGENHIIHISHTPDCIFRSFYTMITFEYHDGDWNQGAGSDEKISLLLGYEDDQFNPLPCVPALETLQSVQFIPTLEEDGTIGVISLLRQYIGFRFFGRGLIDFFSKLIPFILFVLIVIDVVTSSRNRHSYLLERGICKVNMEGSYDLGNGIYEINTDTVTDLLQLSRDEIKKNLIAKYKTLGIVQPLCVTTNGSLAKARLPVSESGVKGGQLNSQSTSDLNTAHSIRRSTGGTNTTLSDSLFFRSNRQARIQDHESSSILSALLPAGLGWREAMRRGIISTHAKIQSTRASRVSILRAQRLTNQERSMYLKRSEDSKQQSTSGLLNDEASTRFSTTVAPKCDNTAPKVLTPEKDSQATLYTHKMIDPFDPIDADDSSSELGAVNHYTIEIDSVGATFIEERNKGSIDTPIVVVVSHDTTFQVNKPKTHSDLVHESNGVLTTSNPPTNRMPSPLMKHSDSDAEETTNNDIHSKPMTISSSLFAIDNETESFQVKSASEHMLLVPAKVDHAIDTVSTSSTKQTPRHFHVPGHHQTSPLRLSKIDGSEYLTKAVAHAPLALSPPPGFASKSISIDTVNQSSINSTDGINDTNVEIALQPLVQQSDDPLGAALSKIQWFGSSIDIFNSEPTAALLLQRDQRNLIPTTDIFSSGNPGLSDNFDDDQSFSPERNNRSFERAIKPQANDYQVEWTNEFTKRKDESSFNFGLDLNILNILDFLDDTVDDEVHEFDANENMDVSHDNAPEEITAFHNVLSLYEDPWNATTTNDDFVTSPHPQDFDQYNKSM